MQHRSVSRSSLLYSILYSVQSASYGHIWFGCIFQEYGGVNETFALLAAYPTPDKQHPGQVSSEAFWGFSMLPPTQLSLTACLTYTKSRAKQTIGQKRLKPNARTLKPEALFHTWLQLRSNLMPFDPISWFFDSFFLFDSWITRSSCVSAFVCILQWFRFKPSLTFQVHILRSVAPIMMKNSHFLVIFGCIAVTQLPGKIFFSAADK